jgi:predicted dehydrogenase
MRYGKSALGHRNGLRVEIFGARGTIDWAQETPEVFTFCDSFGNKLAYDRGSLELSVSRQDRYQRFKAGHPAGFIEALANYYWDIAVALREHKTGRGARFFPDTQVFNADHALEGMRLMEAIHISSRQRRWVDVIPAHPKDDRPSNKNSHDN